LGGAASGAAFLFFTKFGLVAFGWVGPPPKKLFQFFFFFCFSWENLGGLLFSSPPPPKNFCFFFRFGVSLHHTFFWVVVFSGALFFLGFQVRLFFGAGGFSGGIFFGGFSGVVGGVLGPSFLTFPLNCLFFVWFGGCGKPQGRWVWGGVFFFLMGVLGF